VTVSGPLSLAGASRSCARRIPLSSVDSPGFSEAVAGERERHQYLTLFPASDAALAALDYPVGHLLDKAALTEQAASVGLSTVRSVVVENPSVLRTAARALGYPVLIKGRLEKLPVRIARNDQELPEEVTTQLVVQPYIEGTITAFAGLLVDGQLLAQVQQRCLRTWPVPAGVSSAAVTTTPDPDLAQALTRLLDGYQGLFQAQFVDGKLIDLNPRVYGSLPLAVAAGVNLPAMACEVASGGRPHPVVGSSGVHYRWVEGDMRHLVHQARRLGLGGVAAALLPHRNTAHSVISWSDPGPLITRLRHIAGRKS